MDRFSVEELVHITKGTILKKGRVPFIVGAAIDSRAVKADELYIPIVGESLDGHRFIPGAVSNGASVVLTEQGDVELPEDTTVILVDSTVEALKSLGAANRSRCDIPVVSVTGSSGKTTTKDVIASVLSQSYKTMKTQGNYNNQLGIPQTLFQLDSSHEAAVVEMGMDHLGDLHQSIGEVLPHYAVITNVGTAHLEYLKTQENILKAKMETLETLTAEDYAIINGDDPYLSTISNKAYHIIRVGIEAADLDFRATDISSSARGLSFVVQGETYRFAYPGIHNVYNALAAIWIAKDLKMTAGEIQAGLDAFVPSGNRMKLATIDDITYIDDSYNANTDAMRAAINVLVDMGETAEHKIAVLGDMLEMGESGWEEHRKIGEYAASRVHGLIAVGELGAAIAQGALDAGMGPSCVRSLPDAVSARARLKEVAHPGDIVLIKGSHGIHLEKIMEMIKEGK